MSPELQPQDIERVMRPHGDLLPMPRCTDRQQPFNFAHIGFERAEDIVRGFPLPDDFDAFGDMQAYMGPMGTSTPDIPRHRIKQAPLSCSTVSEEGACPGSADGDSDEGFGANGGACTTGLRSVRKRAKRPIADELDDYSDDGGSPNVKDKRVKANRLSAQRSRQRKLEKEAQLTQDVEKLNRQVAAEQHKEHMLINEEAAEAREVQARVEAITKLDQAMKNKKDEINRLKAECQHILEQYPHLASKEYHSR